MIFADSAYMSYKNSLLNWSDKMTKILVDFSPTEKEDG